MFEQFKNKCYHYIDYEESTIFYCKIYNIDQRINIGYLDVEIYQLDLKTLEVIHDFMCFNINSVNIITNGFEYNEIFYTEISFQQFKKIELLYGTRNI